jgi:hypothetical protein
VCVQVHICNLSMYAHFHFPFFYFIKHTYIFYHCHHCSVSINTYTANNVCVLYLHSSSPITQVRDAWSAYKSAQEKAAIREADYQEDMSQLERAKSSDREGMTVHVQSMQEELKAKRQEVSSIRLEHERVVKLWHTLQEESKEWMSKKEHLEASLEVAQANNNQSLQGLREELRQKDSYIDTLQSEHSNVMRHAHQRHDDVEQANSDLTSTLIAKERELTRLSVQQQQQAAAGGRDSALQAEVSRLLMQVSIDFVVTMLCLFVFAASACNVQR